MIHTLFFIVPFLIIIFLFRDSYLVGMKIEELLLYWSIGWIIPQIINGIITGDWK